MKKISYLAATVLVSLLTANCEDSVSDDFEDANGDVVEKFIQSVAIVPGQDFEVDANIVASYDTDGVLTSVTDGDDTVTFAHANGELTSIQGSSDPLNVEELYQSPHNAFEVGEVIAYDDNNNPKTIRFFEEESDSETDQVVIKEYTAEISYDDTPNPYFFTLQAGGIIDALDNVQLNLSAVPQAPEIVQARVLFPVNNISKIVYKDEEGETIDTVTAAYVYDKDNYPTSATITIVSSEEPGQLQYSATFKYVE